MPAEVGTRPDGQNRPAALEELAQLGHGPRSRDGAATAAIHLGTRLFFRYRRAGPFRRRFIAFRITTLVPAVRGIKNMPAGCVAPWTTNASCKRCTASPALRSRFTARNESLVRVLRKKPTAPSTDSTRALGGGSGSLISSNGPSNPFRMR